MQKAFRILCSWLQLSTSKALLAEPNLSTHSRESDVDTWPLPYRLVHYRLLEAFTNFNFSFIYPIHFIDSIQIHKKLRVMCRVAYLVARNTGRNPFSASWLIVREI
ncbi:hypothetical protein ACN38_g3960 [Penicillium nordicum]|uniref:Uncharacterized protein n=1 Tax=Penicillium nordicum TaxID=229535 RepID=A0A0M8P4R7_9EURO|nr:hypothetical protein ACN38_g3960 [Penicillium nordicum]